MAQAGIVPCHLNLKHFYLTSTPAGLLLNTVSFLSYLILVLHIVTNFQLSSSSKQLVGTGGNRSLSLRLETLRLDPTPRRLLLKEVAFLLSLILVFHIVNNFQPTLRSKQLAGTGESRSLLLQLLKHFGLTSTPLGLVLKTASFLSYLILVFHIVATFQLSSSSKQLVGKGGNRSLPLRLETLWLDPHTIKAIVGKSCFSVIFIPRLLHST